MTALAALSNEQSIGCLPSGGLSQTVAQTQTDAATEATGSGGKSTVRAAMSGARTSCIRSTHQVSQLSDEGKFLTIHTNVLCIKKKKSFLIAGVVLAVARCIYLFR